MKIGNYENQKSLLWMNGEDKNYENAIRELRFKKNNIKQLVVKIDHEPTYATKVLIQWFMNQKWSAGLQMTHRLRGDRPYLVSRKMPYKWRHFVPTLKVILYGKPIYLKPGDHLQNINMGMSQEKKDYMSLSAEWKYTPPELPEIPQNIQFSQESELLNELLKAYELDFKATDLIDTYIQHRIPITRLPQDEVVYGWFCDLGIAPRFSDLTNPTDSIVDPETVCYIGKEAILDDVDNYTFEEAY